ncbi:hypothetical protein Pla52o_52330 [Novipirellula galeiformis]|uniref:Uncharacterized protein n=1 Tax=Novipirellula galeiformis TaxID=2528004 RepID=A0A5C6C3J9_9BACT|nr:hypothetical protein [Novipirellula galeiformis]TWU17429.1 hypothetical protein Pla52o_52330 [Novipirellula galeiformis]
MITLLVLVFGLPLWASGDDFAITMQKRCEQSEIQQSDQKLEIKIHSSFGIGRIKVERRCPSTSWPETIVLQIQYEAGKPLKELEGFTLRGEKLLITGSRNTGGQMDQFGLAEDQTSFQDKPSGKANIRVDRTNETMRIVIPGKLLADEVSLEIQWVDYYRS